MTKSRTAGEATGGSSRALPADADRIVGLLLGDARQDAGLPQSAAARALGVPQSRIAKIELGHRQLLFLEAVAVCELYGIALERLDPRLHEPRTRAGRRQRVDLASRRLGIPSSRNAATSGGNFRGS